MSSTYSKSLSGCCCDGKPSNYSENVTFSLILSTAETSGIWSIYRHGSKPQRLHSCVLYVSVCHVCVCTYVCHVMYVSMYSCMNSCVFMYQCLHVCIHVCTYVCMHYFVSIVVVVVCIHDVLYEVCVCSCAYPVCVLVFFQKKFLSWVMRLQPEAEGINPSSSMQIQVLTSPLSNWWINNLIWFGGRTRIHMLRIRPAMVSRWDARSWITSRSICSTRVREWRGYKSIKKKKEARYGRIERMRETRWYGQEHIFWRERRSQTTISETISHVCCMLWKCPTGYLF